MIIKKNNNQPQIYTTDRKWSDKFIPEMKKVIGPYLLTTSTFTQDTEQASDLVVLGTKNKSIACRIRREGYSKYINEFTVRYNRVSGAKTEFAKIMDGFADWMFYGHATNNNTQLGMWWLLDMDIFRKSIINNPTNIIRGIKHNTDETTSFAWFDIRSFPTNLVIGSGTLVSSLGS